jgi:glyoxylase-like metal-dependent hydrolase (beta-lactamase superfamily II)
MGGICICLESECEKPAGNTASQTYAALAKLMEAAHLFGILPLKEAHAFTFTVHPNHLFSHEALYKCCKSHAFFVLFCVYDTKIASTYAHMRKADSFDKESTINSEVNSEIIKCTLIGTDKNQSAFLTEVSKICAKNPSMDVLHAVDDFFSSIPWILTYRDDLSRLLPDASADELTALICEFSHMAEQMIAPERPYHAYMNQILKNGKALRKTSGKGFYADVQHISVSMDVSLFCFQLPGGGNIFVLESKDERVMIDTGYGCYYSDVQQMFAACGLDMSRSFTKVITTHGDTDHCGASGYYDCPVYMHRGTYDIIRTNNRAQGSASENSTPEQGYTTMINRLSGMHPCMNPRFFSDPVEPISSSKTQHETIGGFSVLSTMELAGLSFQILLSYGGHQHGLVYLLCREQGLLFTSDTILNLEYLSEERSAYNQFAVYFLTTVNVDPELVRKERKALLALAQSLDKERRDAGKSPLCICCGHGPLSYIEKDRLIPASTPVEYLPR